MSLEACDCGLMDSRDRNFGAHARACRAERTKYARKRVLSILLCATRPLSRNAIAAEFSALRQSGRISRALRQLHQSGEAAFVHYLTGWLATDNKQARDYWVGQR